MLRWSWLTKMLTHNMLKQGSKFRGTVGEHRTSITWWTSPLCLQEPNARSCLRHPHNDGHQVDLVQQPVVHVLGGRKDSARGIQHSSPTLMRRATLTRKLFKTRKHQRLLLLNKKRRATSRHTLYSVVREKVSAEAGCGQAMENGQYFVTRAGVNVGGQPVPHESGTRTVADRTRHVQSRYVNRKCSIHPRLWTWLMAWITVCLVNTPFARHKSQNTTNNMSCQTEANFLKTRPRHR